MSKLMKLTHSKLNDMKLRNWINAQGWGFGIFGDINFYADSLCERRANVKGRLAAYIGITQSFVETKYILTYTMTNGA